MTNVAYTTLTKVGRMASHGVTLGVTKGLKKGVKLKLFASLHLVIPHFSFPEKMTNSINEKTESTSGSNILINSIPILKNHVRYGSAKEFPTIWDFARLCSFNRLEVMIKKVTFVLRFLLTDKFDLRKKPCQLLKVISRSILNRF